MQIAIIGSGNIGSALAKGLSRAGHSIILGTREPGSEDVRTLIGASTNISATTIADAAGKGEVIIVAVPLKAIPDTAKTFGDVAGKLILETSNAFGKPLPEYANGTLAIKQITGATDVVKCFNAIGAEDLANPQFGALKADAFVAGDSLKAKKVAQQLALDMGFEACYDLGGDEALPFLENLAVTWGALAFKSGLGRRIAFKILRDE
jgi:8-hydroxy-5-deazaflavin:NADPH oxidoreductase